MAHGSSSLPNRTWQSAPSRGAFFISTPAARCKRHSAKVMVICEIILFLQITITISAMKRTTVVFALAALACLWLGSCCRHESVVIRTEVPVRVAGQLSALGMTAEPIENVHVGFIGLGMRGSGAIERFVFMDGASVTALCDIRPECVRTANETVRRHGLPEAAEYIGEEAWKQVCERDDIDLIYICTDWLSHVPIALYAMQQGKHVAVEVPAAMTLEDIWKLIDCSEQTRKHCMMLENCVYDFFELTALQMAREGLFGEIIHVEGAYAHNLDPYWDEYWNSWRLDYNRKVRGDVYPTHGIGPVCQALNMHRGDRMRTLVAMDTDPFNGPRHVEARSGEPCTDFSNGDVSTSLIRTEKGKTILIEHDVMTPRPYSRMYQLVGTDGYVAKYPIGQVCLREEGSGKVDYQNLGGEKVYSGEELAELMAAHHNPIITPELEAKAREVGGHGGMDFIMDYRLIYCLNNGLPLDMDVYDMAEWCCISELSRISMENGSVPVEVPDFTRGEWDRMVGFDYAFTASTAEALK